MSTLPAYDRVLSDFQNLFVGIQGPQVPVDCGGCAPPVYAETERVRDQRIADELREARYAAACRSTTSDEE